MVAWATVLCAQGDDAEQTLVIGAGIGSHAFAEPHRTETESGDLEVRSALMSQVYAEWYILSSLGLGIRFITFGADGHASSTVSAGSTSETVEFETEFGVDSWLATVNWIPLGTQSYARLAVLAGLGLAKYELTGKTTPGERQTASSNGPAFLLGGYVDWGAGGFGARFGVQYLVTDLGDIDGESVDASGQEYYLDLRWAF